MASYQSGYGGKHRILSTKTGVVHITLHGAGASAGRELLKDFHKHAMEVPADIATLNAEIEAASAKVLPLDLKDDARGARAARAASYEHGARRADETIPGLGERDPPVGLAVFEPAAPVEGVYLHFHGGGWVVGSAFGQNDARLQAMADALRVAVVSVDYRLAPENRFPRPVDDSVAAFEWLERRAAERFGATTLVAGGESSGAHLCLAAFLRLAPAVRARYRALNLVYGFYDLEGTPSNRRFDRRLVFNGRELAWFAKQLQPDVMLHKDPACSILRADFPGDLPPALFSAGTHDALLDDTLLMAQKWADVGAEADLVLYPGAAHGVGHFGPHESTHQGADLLRRVNKFLEGKM